MTFTLGVISSLVATGIILFVSAMFSRNVRGILTAIQGRLLHIDVEQVFVNSTEGADAIRREVHRGKRIDVFTGRGSEMQRATFASVLGQKLVGPGKPVRILLPNPTQHGNGCDCRRHSKNVAAGGDRWAVRRRGALGRTRCRRGKLATLSCQWITEAARCKGVPRYGEMGRDSTQGADRRDW